MNSIAQIVLKLENTSIEEAERYRVMIHRLFEEGVFTLRAGRAILHFDPSGNLQRIDWELTKWARDKPSLPLAKVNTHAILETISAN